MIIGKFDLHTPVLMAPMAGITDKAFREIIYRVGGKYVVTEMISDKALLFNNPKTKQMLNLEGEPQPRIVQLFGSEPEPMAKAAIVAENQGADIIDINMGCPTPKIVRNGEGAALMRNVNLAEQIAADVVRAVKIPVTVKMRLGWDHTSLTVIELAQRMESAGVAMITIHARTRDQFYSGRADWQWIKAVKDRVTIPVIGNGDITSPESALAMCRQTQCDGVMIARGALGNPWLIGRAQYYLDTGKLMPEPQNHEKFEIMLLHFDKLLKYKGDKIGVNEMRKHAAWYIKGIRNAAEYRNQIMQAGSPAVMENILRRIYSDNT